MRCQAIKVGDTVAIVCTRGRRPPKCRWCDKPSTKLCDFPLNIGQLQLIAPKTCDAPMCDEHAHAVGVNLDHCPLHKPPRVKG
jgi:hypothetical protein